MPDPIRAQQRLDESRGWQTILAIAYTALTLGFGWEIFGGGTGLPPAIGVAAIVGGLFVIVDAGLRLAAWAFTRRTG